MDSHAFGVEAFVRTERTAATRRPVRRLIIAVALFLLLRTRGATVRKVLRTCARCRRTEQVVIIIKREIEIQDI